MNLLIFGAGAYWHDRDPLTAALPEGGAITQQMKPGIIQPCW